MFVGSSRKKWIFQFQHQMDIYDATDDPDLEMLQMPPTNIASPKCRVYILAQIGNIMLGLEL